MKNLQILIFLFIFILIYFNESYSRSHWHIDNGWVYRNGEKFFAIGIWGIPKYQFIFSRIDSDSVNISNFKDANKAFNLIYVHYGREKRYMENSLLFTGWGVLRWRFTKGFNGLDSFMPDKDSDGILNFYEMKFIKNHLVSYYNSYIKKSVVENIISHFKNFEYIWYLADEPNSGGDGWCWYPSIIRSFNESVKSVTDSSLTFVDLGGSISGDRYTYEQNYIRKFGHALDSLAIGTNTDSLQGDPSYIRSYDYAFDGTSVFKYDSLKNRWTRRPIALFRNKYYANIYQTATGYCSTADVMGLNCYADFFHYPEAANIAVTAIKNACGEEKPVWIYFDGAGYKKPRSMSNKEYIKLVKCQIYISILSGATGVLFWSTKDTENSYWILLKKLANELNINSLIFKSEILRRGHQGPVFYSIYVSKAGQKTIIAANSHKNEEFQFGIASEINITLKPLEVKILNF